MDARRWNAQASFTVLGSDSLTLRAPRFEDAEIAVKWHPEPLSRDDALRLLEEELPIAWGANPTIWLIAEELSAGEVRGSLVVRRSADRTARLEPFVPSGDHDREELLRSMLRLAIPLLLDEVGLMALSLWTAADDWELCAAAGMAGMQDVVRLRQRFVRGPMRVDEIAFEIVADKGVRQ